MACRYEAVVPFLRGMNRSKSLLTIFQEPFIFDQHGGAVPFPFPLGFFLPDAGKCDGGGSRRVGVDAEIQCQLARCIEGRQIEQSGGEVDHVAGGVTAETVEIGFIDFHGGRLVRMERAAAHAVLPDPDTVICSCLRNGHAGLEGIENSRMFHFLVFCQFCRD